MYPTDFRDNPYASKEFIQACNSSNFKKIESILFTSYFSVHEYLILASKFSKPHAIKFLIEKGANVNYDENAAIIGAIKENRLQNVKFLFSAGAIPPEDPLGLSCRINNLDMFKFFLSNGAAVKNIDDLYTTVLYDSRCEKFLVFLLENFKVDINKYKGILRTYHKNMVKICVEYGLDVTLLDNEAIQVAADKKDLDYIKFLVSKGADIHSGNEYVFIKACQTGRKDILEYIISLGPISQETLFRGLCKIITNTKCMESFEYISSLTDYKYQYPHREEVLGRFLQQNYQFDFTLSLARKGFNLDYVSSEYKKEIKRIILQEKYYKRWRIFFFKKWFRNFVSPLYYSPGFPGYLKGKNELKDIF